jgi:hypothetical protein
MKTAATKSKVKSNSLQNTESIETKRLDIKMVTGIMAITSISCEVAGIKMKLSIEKKKSTNRTKKYFRELTFRESYCCMILTLPIMVRKISKPRKACNG